MHATASQTWASNLLMTDGGKPVARNAGNGENSPVDRERTDTMQAHDIVALAQQAGKTPAVRRNDLRRGDCVLVTTRNSVYSIFYVGDGLFQVEGGYFSRHHQGPVTITINGCTWGGRAIHSEIVAARGLFLEFGNQVITTRIQKVQLLRKFDRRPISLN